MQFLRKVIHVMCSKVLVFCSQIINMMNLWWILDEVLNTISDNDYHLKTNTLLLSLWFNGLCENYVLKSLGTLIQVRLFIMFKTQGTLKFSIETVVSSLNLWRNFNLILYCPFLNLHCRMIAGLGLWVLSQLSWVRLLSTPWTVAWEVPLSIGFSRQKYWSGLP